VLEQPAIGARRTAGIRHPPDPVQDQAAGALEAAALELVRAEVDEVVAAEAGCGERLT